MSKSIFFGIPILLFLFAFCPDSIHGQMQQQGPPSPTIIVSAANAKPVTVLFMPQELQIVGREPQFVLKKLGSATAKDCSYPRRISSCIWACKNNRKIRTCEPTLVSALQRLWPR